MAPTTDSDASQGSDPGALLDLTGRVAAPTCTRSWTHRRIAGAIPLR
ncbi:hypothetical protein C731_1836 [Mycolicibacterium hassiacum DSM 44199]|uniref:Uncharacterized protein n=1 Tax=Mycolicibacterium hassiacum (strain DSM 44199 / CIP 105218 / JCM 12690 / 3849) TaxID=1122247 RepID=K5BGJ2_MYCHD|nr:hypothetical protein C731_1836 [Mycolicibacterium hassiacum DSM 44199]